MTHNNTPSIESYEDSLKKIKKEYLYTSEEKLLTLDNLLNEMRQEIHLESLQSFRMIIHKMAGSAGTYGFMQVSDICKQFDKELQEKIQIFNTSGGNANWIMNFEDYLKKIKQGFS